MMQKIKDEIYTSEDPTLFAITIDDEHSTVYLKKYGETKIANSMINIMDTNDIDKIQYFTFYIEPFFKSLVKEFLK
jgi:hypothetical protein